MPVRYKSYLKLLLQICEEKKFFSTSDELDYWFDGYELKEGLSDELQIREAITWSFENDKINEFYLENWDETFFNSDLCKSIMHGSICHSNGQLDMFYSLYRIASKNKYYYKIECSGYLAEDLWDERGFFAEIDDFNNQKKIINEFKDKCRFISTNFDEFDDEVMEDNDIFVKFCN
jgi:hypothetical protein